MTCIIQLKVQGLKQNSGVVNGLLNIQDDKYVLSAAGRLLSKEKATAICNELRAQKTFSKNYKLLSATVVAL